MSYTSVGNDTIELLSASMQPKPHLMQNQFVDQSLKGEYQTWHYKSPVFIDAPTGSRKTTFVYDYLIPDAIKDNKTILLVSNRIALKEQQKKRVISIAKESSNSMADFRYELNSEDVANCSFFGPICVITYQGLSNLLNSTTIDPTNISHWFANLKYAVFDEIHFLYSDALFNTSCGYLIDYLPVVFKRAIRVYMTATSWDIRENIIQAECFQRLHHQEFNLTPIEASVANFNRWNADNYSPTRAFQYYYMNTNYDSYNLFFFDKPLSFLNTDKPISCNSDSRKSLQSLVSLMNPLPTQENKWVIFIDNKSVGRELQQILLKSGVSVAYIDAEKQIPKAAWGKLIQDEEFSESVLIATSILDCGINISDASVKNIAIFSTDRTAFMQLLGRKRLQQGESVNLFVWLPGKAYFREMEKRIEHDLNWASQLNTARKKRRAKPYLYSNIARKIWDNRFELSHSATFYIDRTGSFAVNEYAVSILNRKLQFVQQFTRKDDPLNFRDFVIEWLNKEKAMKESCQKTVLRLIDMLEQAKKHPVSGAAISDIRNAILLAATEQNIKIEHANRSDRFSPKTINKLLLALNIDYYITQKDKKWTAHKRKAD